MKILLSKPHAIAFWQCSIGSAQCLPEFAKSLRSRQLINRDNNGAQLGCDISRPCDELRAISLPQIHLGWHALPRFPDGVYRYVKCLQEFQSILHVSCGAEDVCGKY